MALTATEYEVLRLLPVDAGRVVRSEPPPRRAWKENESEPADPGRVRAFVKRLRAKLGDDAANPGWVFMDKQPENPFHPGEMFLEEFLAPMGISQAAFANRVGWTRTRLNEFIRGKRGVTAAAALDLADALGTSPKLWMNLQTTYDLDKAARARRVA